MSILKTKDSHLQPIRELETTNKFVSNIDKFSLKVKKQKYASTRDVRNKESLDLVELELNDEYLNDN